MKDKLNKVFNILKRIILYFFAFSIIAVIVYRFIPPPFTPLMIIRLADQIAEGKSLKLKKDWESLDNISPNLPLAVMASEDQLFKEHHGFDLKSIKKAWESNNNKKKKKVRGGSTISQQVAKNVFLWPGRTWIRKGLEAYFTVLIEIFWSKKRIMEMYLNVAELGNGIYGAEAASEFYFKKPASKLTKNEAASLAAILPNPRKWSPTHTTAYIERRKAWIKRNMNAMGKVEF